jgi:hypothetical protein
LGAYNTYINHPVTGQNEPKKWGEREGVRERELVQIVHRKQNTHHRHVKMRGIRRESGCLSAPNLPAQIKCDRGDPEEVLGAKQRNMHKDVPCGASDVWKSPTHSE